MSRRDALAEVDRGHVSKLASSIASNYISGEKDIAKAMLVNFGQEQAVRALSRLSVGEFVQLKIRSVLAKAGRIVAALQDGSFSARVGRVIARRIGGRNAS